MEEDHGPLDGLEVSRMEELIKQLAEAAGKNIDIATAIRTEAPGKSFFFWKQADLMEKAIKGLRRNIPLGIETEGGGTTWWVVCPECHGAIDNQDHFCRHCGQAVKK